MGRSRAKTKRPERSQRQPNQDAYDLDSNFTRISKHSSSAGYETSAENTPQREHQQLNSRYFDESKSTSAGIPNDRYDRLDDKIQSLSDKNDTAHTDLRIELEGKIGVNYKNLETKIDKKLSKQWYSWTIGALVAIVGLIYILSYSGLIKKSDSHDREISN